MPLMGGKEYFSGEGYAILRATGKSGQEEGSFSG